MKQISSKELSKFIRQKSLEMCHRGKSSHIGSILSCADILAVLYSSIIDFDSDNPSDEERDRFIMSKGHAGAGLYSALSAVGFEDESILKSHYQDGSFLSGHVCHKLFKGIEVSTGSLGHGLPISVGRAMALKLKGSKSFVYCLMSDGELNEGSNWEAFLSGAHHKLNNIVAIVDRNRLQSIEDTETTLALEPLTSKLETFGWDVRSINGHDHNELKKALAKESLEKPKICIANTKKGKGVSFMENQVLWHYRSPSNDELAKSLNEL